MRFLLTSACAVMLQFIAVHSLFAVSPFPVDTDKRGSLRRDTTKASYPDGGSPWASLGIREWVTPTLRFYSCSGPPLLISAETQVHLQVKVLRQGCGPQSKSRSDENSEQCSGCTAEPLRREPTRGLCRQYLG